MCSSTLILDSLKNQAQKPNIRLYIGVPAFIKQNACLNLHSFGSLRENIYWQIIKSGLKSGPKGQGWHKLCWGKTLFCVPYKKAVCCCHLEKDSLLNHIEYLFNIGYLVCNDLHKLINFFSVRNNQQNKNVVKMLKSN